MKYKCANLNDTNCIIKNLFKSTFLFTIYSHEENKYWFTEIFRCVSNVRKLKFSFKYGDPSNKLDAVRCRHDPMQTCEQCLTVSDSAAI